MASSNSPSSHPSQPEYPPGSRYPLLPGVRSRMVQTPRLAQHVYESGPADGAPAALGKAGVIPGWPGDAACPPQPMVTQIRAGFERYAANGGRYQEVVLPDCGHAPLPEKPDAFVEHLGRFG